MKKVLIILTIIISIISLTGCTKQQSQPSTQYVSHGRYYTDGYIITNDGNCWEYSTDSISHKTPYDDIPVFVIFDNNSTSGNIYDDIILGCTLDVETSIYDNLEDVLSESFELERDDNNIRIITNTK